jgi:hypothetical protein
MLNRHGIVVLLKLDQTQQEMSFTCNRGLFESRFGKTADH